jgi:hypothetical protein
MRQHEHSEKRPEKWEVNNEQVNVSLVHGCECVWSAKKRGIWATAL